MSHDGPFDAKKHIRVYLTVFTALAGLTLVTVAISYWDLSTPVAILVALLVATVKGSMVACYFMHLLSEKKLILWVLLITAIFFIVLMVLPAVTDQDMLRHVP